MKNEEVVKKLCLMHKDIQYIKQDLSELKPEIKASTEFRLQAKGALALIGIVAGTAGSIVVWIVGKLWSK